MLKENPLITIIIPTYNSGQFLAGALNSLLVQRKKNFEIILVDGQSTDNTLQIVDEIKERAQNIPMKVFSERDKGIYDAMNKGVSYASGQYIYFMGCDDRLFNEDTIENITQHILAHPKIDILYGNVARFNNKDITKIEKIETYYKFSGSKLINKLRFFISLGICHQAIFAKKQTLFNHKFSIEYKLASDFDWIISQIEDKRIFRYVNVNIARYNETGSSSDLNLLFIEFCLIIKKHYGSVMARIFYILRKTKWSIK